MKNFALLLTNLREFFFIPFTDRLFLLQFKRGIYIFLFLLSF